jgi:hypothetical protein
MPTPRRYLANSEVELIEFRCLKYCLLGASTLKQFERHLRALACVYRQTTSSTMLSGRLQLVCQQQLGIRDRTRVFFKILRAKLSKISFISVTLKGFYHPLACGCGMASSVRYHLLELCEARSFHEKKLMPNINICNCNVYVGSIYECFDVYENFCILRPHALYHKPILSQLNC